MHAKPVRSWINKFAWQTTDTPAATATPAATPALLPLLYHWYCYSYSYSATPTQLLLLFHTKSVLVSLGDEMSGASSPLTGTVCIPNYQFLECLEPFLSYHLQLPILAAIDVLKKLVFLKRGGNVEASANSRGAPKPMRPGAI